MAYRQLFFVAFVSFGLGAVGCGGESGSSAGAPATDDSVPTNPDSPPSTADDTPPNSDDTPPSSDDTPPGSNGDLQQLCEDVCEFVEQLSECIEDGEGSDTMDLDELCSSGCEVPETSEPIPCRREIAAMFDCILGLGSLCPENGGEAQAAMCQDEAMRFTECADEVEPIDDPEPTDMCTLENSCQQCEDLCETCRCGSPESPEQCDAVCDQ